MRKCLTKKWIGLALASIGAVASSAVLANPQHVESQGGLKVFNPSDSAYWFTVGGRLNFDEVIFSGKSQAKGNNFASGGNLRRTLLKVGGGVGDHLTYNLSLNFDGSNVGFQEAWLGACSEYSGFVDKASVKVGQFVPPTTLDDAANYGTNNDNVFLESALETSAFSMPAQAYGISADASMNDMFTVSAAVYQPRKGDTANYGDANRADKIGASARLTFSPVHTDDTVYHLGVSGRYQSTAKTAAQSNVFWTSPEAQVRNTSAANSIVNTGSVTVRSLNTVSAEALAIFGAAHIEGQYSRASLQRVATTATVVKNPSFNGYHLQAGYVLTGESRAYDFSKGTLGNPKPSDKCGAWELLARYSFVNLNDVNRGVSGGSEHNATVGVNWFVNEHVKLSGNYIRANIRGNAADAKRTLDIYGVRASAAF